MGTTIQFRYRFTFADNETRLFPLILDRRNLTLVREPAGDPPPWTELRHHRCTTCRLDPDGHPFCPIAVNMADIVEEFKNCSSYENVLVEVETAERTFRKASALQEGLSSLMGIVMVTSGCPTMERLKPMVRFHLPFATVQETVFRMVSTYLVAQHYVYRKGNAPDWELKGLPQIYEEVEEVNRNFAGRLREAARKDASLNALVNLDCFAKLVPFEAGEMLAEIEGYFAAYFT